VRGLSIGQRQKGHAVYVAALLDDGRAEPPIVGVLREADVTVVPLVHRPRSYRAQRRAIRAVCDAVAPDVIHSHGYLPDGLSASLGRRIHPLRISTVHGFTGGGWRNRMNEWFQRQSYRLFDAVVAVSRPLAAELSVLPFVRRKLWTVPNAWLPHAELKSRDDARAALELTETSFNIGWVGRITREKGLDVLIEALPALNRFPFRLVVVGDGSERGKLEKRAMQLGVAGAVQWAGTLHEVAGLMPGLDVLVISSRTEGTPITLLEAMHAGLPVVSTSVGGIPDVVSESEAHLVPADDPGALAAAILDVRDDASSARLRAEKAKLRLASERATSTWIDRYDWLYKTVTSLRGQS